MATIQDKEKRAFELRKEVICEKIEEYFANIGGDDDCFINYLKENCEFKFGDVIDFENFKKDYLTDTFRLTKFINIYSNSALDYDELVYFGFGNDLRISSHEGFCWTFYEAIKDYNFTNEDLTLFEEFVDFKYNKI